METNEKLVLVTGGGSGIGAAMCRRFAADGATVVVADSNAETARAVVEEIGGVALTADVGSAEANEAMIEEAEAELAVAPALVPAPAPVAPCTNLSAISGAAAACVSRGSSCGSSPRGRTRPAPDVWLRVQGAGGVRPAR